MKSLLLSLIIFGTAAPAMADHAVRREYHDHHYRREPVCRPIPTVLGALLGGGVAASMSRGDGYYWSVPVGAAIGGGLFGCTQD